jgi:Ca2+-binding EF-hand superfamily protein
MYNAKLFRVRFEDTSEIHKLQERLGFALFFPFIQPENAVFNLDLNFADQRICASMLVKLSMKENSANIQDAQYIRGDGTVDPLTLGVPRSWSEVSKAPKQGRFKCVYICSPEHRRMEARKEIAEQYGFFQTQNLSEEQVQWWTGLTEVPETVLNLLEFLISRVRNVEEAFLIMDGVSGNGAITLREFHEGIVEMGCKKFQGKDEKQQISEIFRYLDPGGEGSISVSEFMVLDQLWKELDLSIREFVQFLGLMFGEDLEKCWDALDDDGSGEMDLDEFLAAVKKIGYFGPAKIVFSLLDSTDDGAISVEEFAVLKKYAQAEGEE